jgi:cytoskeletal protein CcmA (bactofilin family)
LSGGDESGPDRIGRDFPRSRADAGFAAIWRGLAWILIAVFPRYTPQEGSMKYGENLFGRRDTRPNGTTPPPVPTPANSPSATPAIVPSAPRASSEAAPAKPEEHPGSKLIVGPNIKLKGVEIDDCDTLVVEGRVEATMNSRAIQIAEHGAFSGKVDIDVAEIRGNFTGEMTARKRLVIHATGKVAGKIRYGKVLVQEGGELTGEIAALGDGPPDLRPGLGIAGRTG